MRIIVVFPLPFGPIKPVTNPSGVVMLIFSIEKSLRCLVMLGNLAALIVALTGSRYSLIAEDRYYTSRSLAPPVLTLPDLFPYLPAAIPRAHAALARRQMCPGPLRIRDSLLSPSLHKRASL